MLSESYHHLQLGLLVWGRYVSLALRNTASEGEMEEDDLKRALKLAERAKVESQTTPTDSTPTDGRDLKVERSRMWRRETERKLGLLAGRVTGVLVAGGSHRGRRGVVLWAHCLLGNCHKSLVATAPVLLEALLALSHDDYQQVSASAQLSLVSPSLPPSLQLSLSPSPGDLLCTACKRRYI